MSKNKKQIGVSIDNHINIKLEKQSINKSKLINSLLSEWIKTQPSVNEFVKKSD